MFNKKQEKQEIENHTHCPICITGILRVLDWNCQTDDVGNWLMKDGNRLTNEVFKCNNCYVHLKRKGSGKIVKIF